MTTKKTYSEKLKDPRWQKKRLEILQRDDFACQICGDTEKTLHVHHRYYKWGDPWEIENDGLVTLCEVCHEVETAEYKVCSEFLIDALKFAGFFSSDLRELGNGIIYLKQQHLSGVVASAYGFAFSDTEMQSYIIKKYFERLKEKSKDLFKEGVL